MNVVCHIIQENVDAVFVGRFDELLEFCFGTESGVGGAQSNRPIPVVTTEFGGRGFDPLSIRTLRIPHHRRDPQTIHPQFGKKSLFYLFGNPHHIAPVEIYFGIYIRSVQRFIVFLFPIHKAVNHGIVHHHRSGILAIAKFRHVKNHPTRRQRYQNLIAHALAAADPHADITARCLPGRFGHRDFDDALAVHRFVFTQFHWQSLILPHRQH